MTPTEALEQIAIVARTVAGVREVEYPAKGKAPKYPSMVLLWDGATMEYQSTEQYWDMSVRGLFFTGLFNEQRHHIGEVDPVISGIADAFSAGNQDGFLLTTSTGDHCDGCQLVSVELGGIEYAGLQHYGATLTFNVKLRRFNP